MGREANEMSLTEDEKPLRQYLLGLLLPEEQRQLEERLLLDNDLVERLLVVEQEMIDEYACGHVPAEEREPFSLHFLSTPARRKKVQIARALQKYVVTEQAALEPQRAQTKKPSFLRLPAFAQSLRASAWAYPATATLLLVLALGVWWMWHESSLARGVAALHQAYPRPLEARLSNFNYAPWSQQRGAAPESKDSVAADLAKRSLLDAVSEQPNSASHHALGQFYLARGELDQAIKQFEDALKTDTQNAQLHSDYGAALLEKGKPLPADNEQRKELFARSLDQLNQALQLNRSLLEALFNRALLYQSMNLLSQARADWQKYLEQDPHSPWADEARQNLKSL